jgi:TRAP transporter TAXI family solute receptor
MNKKNFGICVALILLVVLAFGACSNKASEAPSGSAAQAANEPYQVDIYSYTTGTFTYVMGMALADIINEQSTWLRATAVEAPGSSANELMMYDADDQKRQHTIYYGIGDNAWRGTMQFENKQNTRSKIAFCIGLIMNGLFTCNPNINKLEDYAGRTIALRAPMSSDSYWWQAIIDDAVKGVKFESIDTNSAAESTLNGIVDGWFGGSFSKTTDLQQWVGNPTTTEFLARAKTIHFINQPKASDQKIRKIPGGPFENFYETVATVPAKALDPRQTEPWDVAITNVVYLTDQDMPEDVIYEMVRLMGENSAKLAEYHPQGAFITPETMSVYTYPNEFHPGSMKYFKEKGVTPTFLGDFIDKLSK